MVEQLLKDTEFTYPIVLQDNDKELFVTTWKIASMYLEKYIKHNCKLNDADSDINRTIDLDLSQWHLVDAYQSKSTETQLQESWNTLFDVNSKRNKFVLYRNPIKKFISGFLEDTIFNPNDSGLVNKDVLKNQKPYYDLFLEQDGFSKVERNNFFKVIEVEGAFRAGKHPFLKSDIGQRFYKSIFRFEFENYLKNSPNRKSGHQTPWLLFVNRVFTEKLFGSNTIFIDIDKENLTEVLQKYSVTFKTEPIPLDEIHQRKDKHARNLRKQFQNDIMYDIVQKDYYNDVITLLWDECVIYKMLTKKRFGE